MSQNNPDRHEGFILLVEDNADDEELAVMALQSAGVRIPIHVARDGAEAIERLTGPGTGPAPARPVVVILDLKLPKVDGFGVLQRIRETGRLRWLPVVILTSSDAADDIARGYELGANSYVRKPVAFEEFASAVGQLGQYWSAINESPGDGS